MYAIFMNYRKIISQYPPIPEDKQLEMLQGTRDQRDRVLLGFGKTIVKIARKYAFNEAEIEDMFQQAWMGLLRAAELFDPKKKIKPITYFTYWIMEKVRKYAQDNRLISLPNLPWKLINEYKSLTETMTHDEALKKMNLTPKRRYLLTQALKQSTSIHTAEEAIAQSLQDKRNMLEDLCENEIRKKCEDILDTSLNEEESRLIDLRKKGHSRRAVGEALGVSSREILKRETNIKKVVREGYNGSEE
jgi:RNA polymerase sigma factor (sigma-70 family)